MPVSNVAPQSKYAFMHAHIEQGESDTLESAPSNGAHNTKMATEFKAIIWDLSKIHISFDI